MFFKSKQSQGCFFVSKCEKLQEVSILNSCKEIFNLKQLQAEQLPPGILLRLDSYKVVLNFGQESFKIRKFNEFFSF